MTILSTRAWVSRYGENVMADDGIDNSTAENISRTEAGQTRKWTEELEVAADQLVALAKRLAAEGRGRGIRLVHPEGILFSICR
jgi:hypothetical protein